MVSNGLFVPGCMQFRSIASAPADPEGASEQPEIDPTMLDLSSYRAKYPPSTPVNPKRILAKLWRIYAMDLFVSMFLHHFHRGTRPSTP